MTPWHLTRTYSSRCHQLSLLFHHWRPSMLHRSLLHRLFLEFQLLLWEATTTTMEDPENPEDMRPSSLVRAPLAHVPSGWRSPTIRMESKEDLW